ncbi:uncharacterized protein [Venturia canescens]|uniref:uncharacterized protein isoform X2 n=1 Tax=Venturia canescens TaxID=32260 RepID=UPI001C9C45CC|nr:uncharacterized protein LOC122415686 isoform X2 [Venturia canescens]
MYVARFSNTEKPWHGRVLVRQRNRKRKELDSDEEDSGIKICEKRSQDCPMENQGYEEEALTSSSHNPTRVNPDEFSSIDRGELSGINRSKIRLVLGGDKLRNEPEAHVYEDIGLSPDTREEDTPEMERMKNCEIEDRNARNLSSLEADCNGEKKKNFHRNLTLPLKRTIGCENSDYDNRYSVRVTNRERTRFTRKNEKNDSVHDSSGVTDEKHYFHRHQEEDEDEDELPRAINHVVDKPGRRRRKKDCKHCKSKANAISLFREDFSGPENPKNPLESSPVFSSPSQLINSNYFINETPEKTRLGIQPIFPSNHQKLPAFHSPDFSPRLSDPRKNSIFSISNNVNSSLITGSPKPLNYDKNETELRLTPVELNDDRALITPMKNRNGMKVNSIYSQEHWRAKDSSIFVTDVKEQTFQRAYSLPTRTHTPTSQNRVNLRRSVRGEPPPHPARLRKNRHGWTLHFARPLDGTGCTRSIVLLLITILALLGIGGIALYIVFEPEKLQVIQQYLRSSTPNATTTLNSSSLPDPLDLQTNIEITTFSTSILTSTENIPMIAQETTFTTETETEISLTSTEIVVDPNVTRHCDDCYDNEVCVALVDEEVPICRTGPDPADPTGCSGLCLINKQKCHRLDFDAFRCVEVEHYCLDDEWTCANTLCIPLVKHCDGHMNCYDHSDEYDCDCDLQTHFQCGNETSCLPVERRCDGKIDCWDASDEINCTLACPSNTEFTCSNGECILKTRFCDGLRDCTDGSDEPHGCQGRCNKQEFSCLNGRCITKAMKCNGIDDCGDESDEQHCRDRIFKKLTT